MKVSVIYKATHGETIIRGSFGKWDEDSNDLGMEVPSVGSAITGIVDNKVAVLRVTEVTGPNIDPHLKLKIYTLICVVETIYTS